MKPKTSFELWRWSYFVILFLAGTALIVLIGEFVAGPLLRWLFDGTPYALPSWNRAKRWALGILFIGFFAGTISWYYEKRSSGR
jgi:hypothetical protein